MTYKIHKGCGGMVCRLSSGALWCMACNQMVSEDQAYKEDEETTPLPTQEVKHEQSKT